MVAVQLAQFLFRVSADVRNVSSGMKLWDLTFRADQNHIHGALQFETQDRHETIQMEGRFCTSCFHATDPISDDTMFYHEFTGSPLPNRAVSTYMLQIHESLRYVQPLALCTSPPDCWTGT